MQYTGVGRHSTSSPAWLFLRPKKRTSRVGGLRFFTSCSKKALLFTSFLGFREGTLFVSYMAEEETLLLSWKKSLGEESVISNDYSVEGDTVTLTVTRCIHEFDIGKSLVVKCHFHLDDINRAIEFLSNNRNILIN